MLKNKNVVLGLSAAVLLGVLATFQNCSNVHFAGESTQSSLGTEGPLSVSETELRVSSQQMPPLKLVFVVDNSYTMAKNQIKLAQAFDQMFQGATSLAKFDVTAFLISTAQQAPAFTSPDLASIAKLQLDPSTINLGQLPANRNVAGLNGPFNSGAVPGDSLGFNLVLSPDGAKASFRPAPVLGASDAGSLAAQPGIHKAAGADYQALKTEFLNRLAVLSSNKVLRDASSGAQQFGSIVDASSGMCAMARVLSDKNQKFLSANDQAAFVLVSDEDDYDPNGTKCVGEYLNAASAPLIKGACEERSTVISYTKAGANSANTCTTSYDAGYNVKFDWSEATPRYDITYSQLKSPAKWSVPQVYVQFKYPVTKYSNVYTHVDYYQCQPVINNGVTANGVCNYVPKSQDLKGDQVANVNAAIKAADNLASTDGRAPSNPKPDLRRASAGSCAAGDPTCETKVEFSGGDGQIDGTSASLTCAQAAVKINAQAVTDGSQPLNCDFNKSRGGDGACPAGAPNCTATAATYASQKVQGVRGDFSGSLCQQKTFSDMQPGTQAGPCDKVADAIDPKSATGRVTFSNVDGGNTVQPGDCGSAIEAAARSAVTGEPSGAKCSITGYYQGSNPPAGSTDGADACQASIVAATNANKMTMRNPKSSFRAGSPTNSTVALDPVSRDIQCSDRCADAKNIVCKDNADPNITVADFLKAKYGAKDCSRKMVATSSAPFKDRLQTDQASVCVGTDAKPKYLVPDGGSYVNRNLITQLVGESQTLPDYIKRRSTELFGGLNPMTTAFVVKADDKIGDGQSVGTQTSVMALSMGGQIASVNDASYAPAFSKLSGIIQKRLQRTFVVSGMQSHQTVKAVQIKRNGVGDYVPLDSSTWTASGNTVNINESVPLSLDDQLKFQYF